MAQQYLYELERHECDDSHDLTTAARHVALKLVDKCVAPSVDVALNAAKIYPNAAEESLAQALIAIPTSLGTRLFKISEFGQSESPPDDIPYVMIGGRISQSIAMSFLKYLLETVLRDDPLNLATGTLLALWAMKYAIRNDDYLKGPIDIVTIAENGQQDVLDPVTVSLHIEAIAAVERGMHNIARSLQNPSAEGEAPAPAPPLADDSRGVSL